MVFLKDFFFEKVDFQKNLQTTKKHAKFPRVISTLFMLCKLLILSIRRFNETFFLCFLEIICELSKYVYNQAIKELNSRKVGY